MDALADGQQEGLRVEQDGPAGQAGQQQDEDAPLQDHAHHFQVAAAVRLPATARGNVGGTHSND